MSDPHRPVSPHLGIYRPQITSVLSILHRMTGIALGLGSLLLVIWITALAGGEQSYQAIKVAANSWAGFILLLGFSFALYYHLFNGIRHLLWDTGRALSLKAISLTGWLVIMASGGATFLTWWLVRGNFTL